MARRLPPLNALRAFEAAARHLSFTKAAQELHVTQAAVSHQVKGLEDHLQIRLFRRRNRALLLTDAGQTYLPPVRDALDAIAAATEQLHGTRHEGPLRISTLPSFAVKWLLPRLPRFEESALASGVELSTTMNNDVMLSTSLDVVDLHDDNFDAAIRFTHGQNTDLDVTHLMDDAVFPVCAPGLREGPNPLNAPADLRHHVLLQDVVRDTPDDPGWHVWLAAAGLDGMETRRGPGFSDSSMVIQTAIAGHGVALARHSLVRDDLASGQLVCPFGPVIRTGFSYWFATTPGKTRDPRVRAFRDWLLRQIREEGFDRVATEADIPGQTGAARARHDG